MVRGSSVAQAFRELTGEPLVERAFVPGRDIVGKCGPRPARREQGVGHAIGIGARRQPGRDLVGQPTQVLDQDDAQRDRDRPQLADRQRLNPLIGR